MPSFPSSDSSDDPNLVGLDSTASSSAAMNSHLQLPCGVTLQNRLVKVAMAECLSAWGGGPPNEKHIELYRAWAEGGWAMIITGNVSIDPLFLSTPKDLALPSSLPPPTAPLPVHLSQPWTDFTSSYKSSLSTNSSPSPSLSLSSSSTRPPPLIAQISHPGRQSPLGCHPFLTPSSAPSPIRVGSGESSSSWMTNLFNWIMFDTPSEMSDEDVRRMAERFGEAAGFLERVGFDGVEVHGAHGYLISQFLSPLSNRRPSSSPYSLSPASPHLSLGLELLHVILLAIRQRTSPSFVVGIKLSCGDFVQGGLSEEDALEQVRAVREMVVSVDRSRSPSDANSPAEGEATARGEKDEKEGWDFLEISGGGYSNPVFALTDGPNVSFQTFTQKLLSVPCSSPPNCPANRHPPPILLSSSLRSISSISSAICISPRLCPSPSSSLCPSPTPSPTLSDPSPSPSAHLIGFARPSVPFPRLPTTHLLRDPPLSIPPIPIPNVSLWKALLSVGGRVRLAGAGVSTLYWTFVMGRMARGEEVEGISMVAMGFAEGIWGEVVAGMREGWAKKMSRLDKVLLLVSLLAVLFSVWIGMRAM